MKKTFYLEKLCNLVESLSAHWSIALYALYKFMTYSLTIYTTQLCKRRPPVIFLRDSYKKTLVPSSVHPQFCSHPAIGYISIPNRNEKGPFVFDLFAKKMIFIKLHFLEIVDNNFRKISQNKNTFC